MDEVAEAPAVVRTLRGPSRVGPTLRRIGTMFVVLFVISIGVFSLTHLSPGGPEQALTAGRPVSEQTLTTLHRRFGLDKPVAEQYWLWLQGAVQGDFGRSFRSNQSVGSLISSHALVSLQLAGLAFALVLVVSLPLALLAAVRRRTAVDRAISGSAAFLIAAPPFAVATLLLYVFGVQLRWLPAFGAGSGVLGRVEHLILPAAALAVGVLALVLKIARAALVDVLEQEYVTFARARGLSRRKVLVAYALRNGLGPVATAAGLTFGSLVASTVLVEQTFALSGLGTLLIESVRNHDIPVVQGVSLTIAAMVLVVNLGADLLYARIDPRIDLGSSSA